MPALPIDLSDLPARHVSKVPSPIDGRTVVLLLALSAAAVLTNFAWQGTTGFNIADEGFLWYGSQGVVRGEVPQLDFMAYEPGRYYWTAAAMSLLHDDGIVALRKALAALQVVALTGALLIVASVQDKRVWSTLLLCCVIFLLWMYPSHKLFDIAVSIALVASVAWCIRKPMPARYFLLGASVGAVTIVGRNHGLYGAIGSLIAIAYLAIRGVEVRWVRAFSLLAAGFASVACAALAYASSVPGWLYAIRESFLFVFEQGGTNLPLPIPWPWRAKFGAHFTLEEFRQLLLGTVLLGLIAVPTAGYYWAMRQPVEEIGIHSVALASTFLALPYAHYAFSRADLGHITLAAFPALLLLLAMVFRLSRFGRLLATSTLVVVSAVILAPAQPGWQAWRSGNWQQVAVARDTLLLEPGLGSVINLLRALADRYAPDDSVVLVTPYWPGAYPILSRKAPVWEIYAVWPRGDRFQAREIERLDAAVPRLVVITDVALDGREELRFHNTHPLLDRYIRENFEPVPGLVKPDYMYVYCSRNQAGF
ncbi:MAG TPA: hypothetical protein VKG21_13350 [Casimicrobiaceae bacterium]|nr:hypothetical protein [Casimicrobiaceae bacterium]